MTVALTYYIAHIFPIFRYASDIEYATGFPSQQDLVDQIQKQPKSPASVEAASGFEVYWIPWSPMHNTHCSLAPPFKIKARVQGYIFGSILSRMGGNRDEAPLPKIRI
jgi:hypothetical protein